VTHDAYATTELTDNTPESTLGASSGSQSVAPSQIGRYTVLGQLGSGGQADVLFPSRDESRRGEAALLSVAK